jgi:hypothetical protein
MVGEGAAYIRERELKPQSRISRSIAAFENGRRLFVTFVSVDNALKEVIELRELARMGVTRSEWAAFIRCIRFIR